MRLISIYVDAISGYDGVTIPVVQRNLLGHRLDHLPGQRRRGNSTKLLYRTASAPVPAGTRSIGVLVTVPSFDHVFFTILQNKSYDQVIGNAQAPYLSALAANNTSLGASYGVVHPSDPNYLAVAGGSTFGHTDNPWPAGMGTRATAPAAATSTRTTACTASGYRPSWSARPAR